MRASSSRDSILRAFTLAASFALLVGFAAACASLKSAPSPSDTAVEGDGAGGSAGESGGPAGDLVGSGANHDGGGDASSGGGDPRFALWPIPADVPASDAYLVTNGADGAIVKDKVTGLEWQDSTSGQTYDFDGAGAYCAALVYDGVSDWRMPTRIEAISIMSIKPAFGESAVTGPAFTPVTAYCTWTASRSLNTSAFSITPASVSLGGTSSQCAARCVRGGLPLGVPDAKKYLPDATTVRDPDTGLVWERNPPFATSPLAAADARCKALSIGTPLRSMRLPTFKELASIVDETRSSPAAALVLGVWRERAFSSNPRWTVDFDNGGGGDGPTSFLRAARCVYGP